MKRLVAYSAASATWGTGARSGLSFGRGCRAESFRRCRADRSGHADVHARHDHRADVPDAVGLACTRQAHTRHIPDLGGLATPDAGPIAVAFPGCGRWPRWGCPGTSGFVSEILIFFGVPSGPYQGWWTGPGGLRGRHHWPRATSCGCSSGRMFGPQLGPFLGRDVTRRHSDGDGADSGLLVISGARSRHLSRRLSDGGTLRDGPGADSHRIRRQDGRDQPIATKTGNAMTDSRPLSAFAQS